MKIKVIDKPVSWSERTLIMASEDEIVADMVIRQGLIGNLKKSKNLFMRFKIFHQLRWIKLLQKELKSRYIVEVS